MTLTTGAGATVTADPGDIVWIATDGADVKTPGYGGSALKGWVENLAWTYNAGNLPAQAGNAGRFVRTDGTTAAWSTINATDMSDYEENILGMQVALAVAL